MDALTDGKHSLGSSVGMGGVATLLFNGEAGVLDWGVLGAAGLGQADAADFADRAGEARSEFESDFEIPTASTLAGLVGCWVLMIVSGSVGGALDARGGTLRLLPPDN